MALNGSLLRSSFALVLERNPEPTHRFYEILFERYPAARKLFGRNSQKEQEKMLAQALVAVMDHLEDAPWLRQNLRALGAKHIEYGVTRPMYDWVGESLLATFAEIAQDAWTPEVAMAWIEAYSVIRDLMLDGAPVL